MLKLKLKKLEVEPKKRSQKNLTKIIKENNVKIYSFELTDKKYIKNSCL